MRKIYLPLESTQIHFRAQNIGKFSIRLIHVLLIAEKSLRDGVVVFVLHNVGILTGIGLLFALAYAGGDFLTEAISNEE